jgi:hypothetical protein
MQMPGVLPEWQASLRTSEVKFVWLGTACRTRLGRTCHIAIISGQGQVLSAGALLCSLGQGPGRCQKARRRSCPELFISQRLAALATAHRRRRWCLCPGELRISPSASESWSPPGELSLIEYEPTSPTFSCFANYTYHRTNLSQVQ